MLYRLSYRPPHAYIRLSSLTRHPVDSARARCKNVVMLDPVILIASGDLRLAANQKCWPAQARAEEAVMGAIRRLGRAVERGHACDPAKGHGFIDSQKRGMEVFRGIPPHAPLVVVEAVWQYSHHILHGLYSHRGPILTVANWSGEWPGLVGMLNLNASLTKAGVPYSSLWSVGFHRRFLPGGLAPLAGGRARGSTTPATCVRLRAASCRRRRRKPALAWPAELRRDKAILGVFDEGCMGMYNAIIPDELLHPTGVFKERLSQSALYAEMLRRERRRSARSARLAGRAEGMQFRTGSESRDRPDRRPDPGAVQDVHRGAADRRRFRLRRHRHSVSARA